MGSQAPLSITILLALASLWTGQARPSANPTRNEGRSPPTLNVSPQVCAAPRPGVATYSVL